MPYLLPRIFDAPPDERIVMQSTPRKNDFLYDIQLAVQQALQEGGVVKIQVQLRQPIEFVELRFVIVEADRELFPGRVLDLEVPP